MSQQQLIPRKTFGALTVYERDRNAAERRTMTKYVVFNNQTNRALEDFRRYATAARWAKNQPEGAGDRTRMNHK